MQSADYTQHTQFFSVTIFAIFWFTILQRIASSLCRMNAIYLHLGLAKRDLWGRGEEFVVASYPFSQIIPQ